MAQKGIDAFDRTLQVTNTWLAEISNEMNHPDRQVAYHALRGVLFAIRDRLVPEEAMHLAAQLPLLVRGVFFEGYRLSGKPESFNRDAFIARVNEELQQAGGANPSDATRAVFAVLSSHLSEGQVEQVHDMLPEDLRALWPETTA